MKHDQLIPEARPRAGTAPAAVQPNVPRPGPRRSAADTPPSILSFRLDEASAAALAGRAARFGVSPHELAREYVLAVLQEAEERAALFAAIMALRQDVGLAAGVLLSSAGKVSEDEARAWVKANFS